MVNEIINFGKEVGGSLYTTDFAELIAIHKKYYLAFGNYYLLAMMKSLEQKSYSETSVFSIEDAGLKKKTEKRNGINEFQLPYEKITTTRRTETHQNKALLVFGCAASLAGIISLLFSLSDSGIPSGTIIFWILIGVGLLTAYFVTRADKTYLYTTDNTAFIFYNDKPSLEEVNTFITEIIKTRNEQLILKYGMPNKNLPYASQLENLNWLLNIQAITLNEYNDKVAWLNNIFNTTSGKSSIGFSTVKD